MSCGAKAQTTGIVMDLPAHLLDFWKAFSATQTADPTPRFLEAFHFDDNEPNANELAALVLSGAKQATAGLQAGSQAGCREGSAVASGLPVRCTFSPIRAAFPSTLSAEVSR
jgi:hypothetical protein